ncbi:hypothetical protein QAD02_014103 [Eretmocerus hayati]|uniref:Uncharacterized protein n=1 Tax=Eretmocerus hayati TaxID=131215 RepID=A0ACC2P5J9_9HYME|nr:hypothetical protein QAD02_014103 [Eretmocerus hayati]
MMRSSSAVQETYGGISTLVTERTSQTSGLYNGDCETNGLTGMKKETYGGISTLVTERTSQTSGLYKADRKTNGVARLKDVTLLELPIWILGPIPRLGHEPQALASLTVRFGCEVSELHQCSSEKP